MVQSQDQLHDSREEYQPAVMWAEYWGYTHLFTFDMASQKPE